MSRGRLAPSLLGLVLLACGARGLRSAPSAPPEPTAAPTVETPLLVATAELTTPSPEKTPTPIAPSTRARFGGPVRVVTPLWIATATPRAQPTPTPAGTATTAATETPGVPPAAATWTASPTPTATPDPCAARVYEQEPAEPFDWIGIVEVQRQRPTDRFATLVESARQSACRLGGDGLVIIYRASQRPGGVVERPQPGMLPNVDLRAVVIRFRR